MSEKTLFLFELVPEQCFFFELRGDHSRFNGVYINTTEVDPALAKELNDLMFDPDTGREKIIRLTEPTRSWTHFVKCGFYL